MEDDRVVALDAAARERLVEEVVALMVRETGLRSEEVRLLVEQSLPDLEAAAVVSRPAPSALALSQGLRRLVVRLAEKFAAWQARILPVVNASSLRGVPCLDQLVLQWIGEQRVPGWSCTSREMVRYVLVYRLGELVVAVVDADEVFGFLTRDEREALKVRLVPEVCGIVLHPVEISGSLRDQHAAVTAMAEWFVAQAQGPEPFQPLEGLIVNLARTETMLVHTELRQRTAVLLARSRAMVEENREAFRRAIQERIAHLAELIRVPLGGAAS